MYAAQNGHNAVVETLSDLGADKDLTDDLGLTASNIAPEEGVVQIAEFLAGPER